MSSRMLECEVWSRVAASGLQEHHADAGTRVVIHDRHPSKVSLDEAIASGSATGPECLAQLDALLVELDAAR